MGAAEGSHAVSEIVEFHVVGSGSENMPRSCQLGVILFVMELDYRESRGNTQQSDSTTSMRPIFLTITQLFMHARGLL